MDTTKIIKLFVTLELFFLAAALIIWSLTQPHLPPLLQEYLDQEMETKINIVDLITIPVLLIYIISAVGLLLTEMWAKNRDGPHGLYRDWTDISVFLYDEPSAQERNDEKIKTESFAGIQSQSSLSRCAGRPHHGGVGLPAAGR